MGVVLSGFDPSSASVNQAGQTLTLTGTQAQIEAALAAMTATPPLHSDVDFDLTVTITASETMPNGGEVTTLSADHGDHSAGDCERRCGCAKGCEYIKHC
ncbi:MAG: hypothetical protein U5K75_11795 [Ahrensia sp.]|nr:hypothetical protein [Ahrensia sp.]